MELYERLALDDIRAAADLFRPIYDRTDGGDGFVSMEVSPRLARDTGGTVAEALRLWAAINRPNVFIKVPGTREGLPAIRQLIAQGVNVNITLLFGLPRYREVVNAYLDGLADRSTRGLPLGQVASVASFFLSRIDLLVDPILEAKMLDGGVLAEHAAALRGEVAIASARVAYQMYRETISGDRFGALAARGARRQRVLWASTSTKNPAYSDVKYVEALIGPETVNTVPLETLNAYRDHGNPAPRLEEGVAEAHRSLRKLAELGVDLDEVTRQLEEEGIEKFRTPFDRLLQSLERASTERSGSDLGRMLRRDVRLLQQSGGFYRPRKQMGDGNQEVDHAGGSGRTGTHGRRHGAATPEGGAELRGLRP